MNVEVSLNDQKRGVELLFSNDLPKEYALLLTEYGYKQGFRESLKWYAPLHPAYVNYAHALKEALLKGEEFSSVKIEPSFTPSEENIDHNKFSYVTLSYKKGETIKYDNYLLFDSYKKVATAIATQYGKSKHGVDLVRIDVYPRNYKRKARTLLKEGKVIVGTSNSEKAEKKEASTSAQKEGFQLNPKQSIIENFATWVSTQGERFKVPQDITFGVFEKWYKEHYPNTREESLYANWDALVLTLQNDTASYLRKNERIIKLKGLSETLYKEEGTEDFLKVTIKGVGFNVSELTQLLLEEFKSLPYHTQLELYEKIIWTLDYGDIVPSTNPEIGIDQIQDFLLDKIHFADEGDNKLLEFLLETLFPEFVGKTKEEKLETTDKNTQKKNARAEFTLDEFIEHGSIGFDKLSHYKPSAVRKAKKVMGKAIELGYAIPYDFGRGKGKYITTDKAQGMSYEDIFTNVYKGIHVDELLPKAQKHPISENNTEVIKIPIPDDVEYHAKIILKTDREGKYTFGLDHGKEFGNKSSVQFPPEENDLEYANKKDAIEAALADILMHITSWSDRSDFVLNDDEENRKRLISFIGHIREYAEGNQLEPNFNTYDKTPILEEKEANNSPIESNKNDTPTKDESFIWVVYGSNDKIDSLQISEQKAIDYINRRPEFSRDKMRYERMNEQEALTLWKKQEEDTTEKPRHKTKKQPEFSHSKTLFTPPDQIPNQEYVNCEDRREDGTTAYMKCVNVMILGKGVKGWNDNPFYALQVLFRLLNVSITKVIEKLEKDTQENWQWLNEDLGEAKDLVTKRPRKESYYISTTATIKDLLDDIKAYSSDESFQTILWYIIDLGLTADDTISSLIPLSSEEEAELFTWDQVKNEVHDGSGVEHLDEWLWGEIAGVYYPKKKRRDKAAKNPIDADPTSQSKEAPKPQKAKKSKYQYGFDGTDFESVENFRTLLEIIGSNENYKVGKYPKPSHFKSYLWEGKDIKIVTANNPLLWEGYASFIGIEGTKEQVLKAVKYIEDLTGFKGSKGLEYISFNEFEFAPPKSEKSASNKQEQDWELTPLEYQQKRAIEKTGSAMVLDAADKQEHEAIVKKALSKRKPVPQKVLDHYPDLIAIEVEKPPTNAGNYNYIDEVVAHMHDKYASGERPTKKQIEILAKELGVPNMGMMWEAAELSWLLWYKQIYKDATPFENRLNRMIHFWNELQPTYAYSDSSKELYKQYSTPCPIGAIIAQYTCMHTAQKIFEPSAGNGLLLVGADPGKTHVNEIDPTRIASLKFQGFHKVTTLNASEPFPEEIAKQYDVVVTNPPFARWEDEPFDKDIIIRKYFHRHVGLAKHIRLEHLMAGLALYSMKDTGRAAIIMMGHVYFGKDGFLAKYRPFFNWLFRHYKVDDVINMNSFKLYNKQGAIERTMLILVGGRKTKPEGVAPTQQTAAHFYDMVNSFSELWERVKSHIDCGIGLITEQLKIELTA